MASGSSGRATMSGSKGFDFGSDDILCSYEDYGANHDGSNGAHSDPGKEFHKTRMVRAAMFPSASYSPPEESSLNQDMISAVDKGMKKYADNMMRFLEGISSRLSQLELYCYNLDKSVGEMRSDLDRDHEEVDSKLKSVEKHLQEVHRSVQVLRDRQELAETQKELAKLQLVQKESSTASNAQQNEERGAPPADVKKGDNSSDMHGQQLALVLPHQIALQPAPRPSLPSHPMEQPPQPPPVAPQPPIPSQSMTQSQSYYLPSPQMTNLPIPPQMSQGQYMPPISQYQSSQIQDVSRVAPQPTSSQVNHTPQMQSLPPYQQQWPQQVQQLPPSSMQPQMKPSSAVVYPSYMPSQPNTPSPEMVPNSTTMQVPFSAVPQPAASRPEVMPYGYGGAGKPVQPQPQHQPQPQPQPPPQHLKASFSTQPGDGYAVGGSHPTLPGNTYVIYDESGRAHHLHQQPHFSQGAYPPASMPVPASMPAPASMPSQNPPPPSGSNMMIRPPTQFVRSHPYNDLIEKLVSMGYRGDHVVGIIQRIEESGQPVDFNAVLDRLNGHSSGGPPRGWSG